MRGAEFQSKANAKEDRWKQKKSVSTGGNRIERYNLISIYIYA